MNRLKNKVALVTGGSRGIGAAIARRLAQEGAKVAITYVSAPDKAQMVLNDIESKGTKGLAIAVDSSDANALNNGIQQVITSLGKIDILINNAGTYHYGVVPDISLEAFDRLMAVNVRAVFVASQAVARQMQAGDRIITIGSSMAERVAGPAASLYAMSKSALIGLTKGMARDLGPRGITVNLVQPGSTDTDMNPKNGPAADWQRGLMALPEFGQPEDIASLVAYLASSESRFMTAAALTMDGGANA